MRFTQHQNWKVQKKKRFRLRQFGVLHWDFRFHIFQLQSVTTGVRSTIKPLLTRYLCESSDSENSGQFLKIFPRTDHWMIKFH